MGVSEIPASLNLTENSIWPLQRCDIPLLDLLSPHLISFVFTMKCLFYGGGAVGAFYAWRLKLTVPTARVDIVCRSNFEAVKKHGYNIYSILGNSSFKPDNVYGAKEDFANYIKKSGDFYDYVFLSTKVSFNKAASVDLVKDVIKPKHTVLVLLQNGIGIEQPYAEAYPDTTVLTAVLMLAVAVVNQNDVHHTSNTRTIIGPYYISKTKEKEAEESKDVSGPLYSLKQLCGMLSKASVKTTAIENATEMQASRWSKLSVNLVYGGTQALSGGCNNGDIWSEELVGHSVACVDEIFKAGETIFKLPFPRPHCPTLESLRQVADDRPELNVSFTRDWLNGNEPELDAIFTNTLKVAKMYNVDMPRADTMYSLLRGYKFNPIKKPGVPYKFNMTKDKIIVIPE